MNISRDLESGLLNCHQTSTNARKELRKGDALFMWMQMPKKLTKTFSLQLCHTGSGDVKSDVISGIFMFFKMSFRMLSNSLL